MPNLFKSGAGQWTPDADALNAPEGALLRSDNLVEDAPGALSLRAGSSLIYQGLEDLVVHSLHTVKLAGLTHRFMGVDNRLYIDGVIGTGAFDGSGDIAMGDDAYQAFFARGTTKKAYDGVTLRNWGIPKPAAAPTLGAVDAITTAVAAFNNTESPAVTAPEGSTAYTTDDGAVANEAIQLTPASATSRGSLQRLWTTNQNFFDIKGTEGTDNDQFDVLMKMAEPRNVEKIVLQFGVGDSSTVPFDKDRYEFTIDIKNGEVPQLKDITSSGYAAYEASVLALLQALDPTFDVGKLQTPEQVKTAMAAVGSQPSPKTGGRPDPDTWSHVTITRGMFTRIGATAGRGWNTVRGFRITYVTRAGTTSAVTFCDALWSGGGDLSLTGKFRVCFRAGRNAGQYVELSPPSAASDPITLNHQTLRVTIAAATLSALEGYADQLWVYLFGGLNLNTWYRFAVTSASTRGGMTIDEFSNPLGADFGTIEERTRLSSHGFTYSQLNGDGVPHITGTTDLVMTIRKSEEQALSEGLRMEPYQISPPDNIVGIAGPWAGRMFVLTSDGSVWPSSNLSPSSFNSRQRLDLTRYGDPMWILHTTGGVYVGMSKDIIFLEGSGDDSADLTLIELFPRAMGIGNPPVDAAAWVEGSTIIFRSADGLMAFTGAGVNPIPFAGTELLWRNTGGVRHGVSPLNTATGRFRLTFDNGILYMLAPEGTATSTNVIYRLKSGAWRRFVYAQVEAFHSILTDPDGLLIAGDDAGQLWLLEDGVQDNGQDIAPELWTPCGAGGDPLSYKDPMDLQLHVDTSGDQGTLAVYLDAATTPAATYNFSTQSPDIYRIQADDIGKFIRAQLRITGTFTAFVLSAYNLAFRPRVQHRVVLDTGWFGPQQGDLLWAKEAEIDCISPVDLEADVYFDDILHPTQPVVVTPSKRSVFRIPLPRGSKGKRGRIVFRTTSADGVGAIGFEAFLVRLLPRNTGNQPLVVFQAEG